MSGRTRILIVDDEAIIRESLIGWLEKAGYEVDGAEGGIQALEMLTTSEYDLVFLEIGLPDMGGTKVLRQVKCSYPHAMVVIVTGHESVGAAMEAMKQGANDCLRKPFDPEDLALLVERFFQQKKIIDENILLREHMATHIECEDLIGTSFFMEQLLALIDDAAKVDSPVLIRGETDTGKRLVAKAIHSKSGRCNARFVPINCGAFTETRLESELFGYEAESLAGSTRGKKGCIEMADGGTLFLDEIGEIPVKMQMDLLRVLEGKGFHPVGGEKNISVDFRLIGATHRDLTKEIARGSFRQDFYYRLNAIEIEVPPLRMRKDDIPVLAEHFLKRFRKETNKHIMGIQQQGIELLKMYDWPGNVRELENAIERAVVLAEKRYLTSDDFSFLFRPGGQVPLQSLRENERQHIDRILKLCKWNISRAARTLEVSRMALYTKIKKYGLQSSTQQWEDR